MGALLGAGKRLITGESLFMTVFTNQGSGKQQVAFAAPYPGKILAMDLKQLGGQLICQKDSFLCAARGVSIVTSFFAPYVCDDCDQEHTVLLDVRMHGADLAKQRAPAMKCPDCNRDMEFADPPELYFMFLSG